MNTEIKPSRYFYFIPFGIFLLGILLAIVFFILLIFGIGDVDTIEPSEDLVFEVTEGDTVVFAIDEYMFLTYNITVYDDYINIVINGEEMTYSFNPNKVKINLLGNNTSLSINGFSIVLEFQFLDTGTTVITSSTSSNDFPNILFGTIDASLTTINLLFIGIFASGFGGFSLAVLITILIKVKRNASRNKVIRAAQKIIDKPDKSIDDQFY